MNKKSAAPKPMDEEGCSSCRFWKEGTEAADQVRWGDCRRYPPQLVAVEADEGGAVEATQPTTVLPFWCGEFKGRLQ